MKKLTWLQKGLRHLSCVHCVHSCTPKKLTWLQKGLRRPETSSGLAWEIRRNWPDYRRDYDECGRTPQTLRPETEEIDLITEGITTYILRSSATIWDGRNWPDYRRDYDVTYLAQSYATTGEKKLTWLQKGLRHGRSSPGRQLTAEEIDLITEGITTIARKSYPPPALWEEIDLITEGITTLIFLLR